MKRHFLGTSYAMASGAIEDRKRLVAADVFSGKSPIARRVRLGNTDVVIYKGLIYKEQCCTLEWTMSVDACFVQRLCRSSPHFRTSFEASWVGSLQRDHFQLLLRDHRSFSRKQFGRSRSRTGRINIPSSNKSYEQLVALLQEKTYGLTK